ncbi:MAG: 1,4-dihydroxy-2-naphthoate polyprenyltransferase [Calditrichaeota bacterium]|nr:1,4-dihydroxy-2-naphthoate polyprenyltransferase [Calditrichota bacterium]RQW02776.1 MAG: 1,4-dihydroxy-2-naphthoate polyprenyltransferase [Calditrichota bacterium]
MKTNPHIWILASRPKTLWAAISPVVIGSAMAYGAGKFHLLSALLAGTASVLIQIGTNFANDYFDFTKGADHHERLGPLRVTQAGLVKPYQMRNATIIIFSLAFLVGIYLIWRGGWPVFIIGILSILFGVLYTAGPYPLGYNGLGDIFVLIFFGIVAVGGTYYVQTLQINWLVILAGVSPGLFSMAILTVNNLRDIKTDMAAGKRTLAVRFGENFARWEYLASVLIACLIPILLYFLTSSHLYALAASFVFVGAIPSIKTVFEQRPGIIFNEVLATTGKLLLLYSIIFSAGWIL